MDFCYKSVVSPLFLKKKCAELQRRLHEQKTCFTQNELGKCEMQFNFMGHKFKSLYPLQTMENSKSTYHLAKKISLITH